MKIFTIGFTKKSAQEFFTRLQVGGVKRLVDVRLNNESQLAGFAKKNDLAYFVKAICGIDYLHMPELSPTKEILDAFKGKKMSWENYEINFKGLLIQRGVDKAVSREVIDGACLLCSEDEPSHCHRRLVVEYLAAQWGGVEIVHL